MPRCTPPFPNTVLTHSTKLSAERWKLCMQLLSLMVSRTNSHQTLLKSFDLKSPFWISGIRIHPLHYVDKIITFCDCRLASKTLNINFFHSTFDNYSTQDQDTPLYSWPMSPQVSLSLGKAMDRPKTAIFASKFSLKRMLAVFTSLRTIRGLHLYASK